MSDAPTTRECRVCGNNDWELELTLPLWIPSVTGSFGTGKAETPDSDFGKRLRVDSSIRFAMMGKLRARYGPYMAQVDTFGASLTNDIGFTFAEDDFGHVDLVGGFLRLAASYRVPAFELGHLRAPFLLSLAPYAGTRLYRISLGYESDRRDFDTQRKWWDPIIGLTTRLDFRIGLVLNTELDVGGFGAGNEIAWWFVSSLEYGFVDWFALSLGWTYMRFEKPAGDTNASLQLSLNGPQLALTFYIQ